MTDKTLMPTTTITVELSEPQAGVYLAKATRDDGEITLVESNDSIYEASAYALAHLTAAIVPAPRYDSHPRP